MKTIMLPTPGFQQQVLDVGANSLRASYSGQITVSKLGLPVGTSDIAGYVKDVWLSVGACGRDDSNTLSVAADLKINGTTCMTTQPKIYGKNGAASANRTTAASGEGVIEAVIDDSAASVARGDVLTWDLTLVRTATPTTEMANAFLVVELSA